MAHDHRILSDTIIAELQPNRFHREHDIIGNSRSIPSHLYLSALECMVLDTATKAQNRATAAS